MRPVGVAGQGLAQRGGCAGSVRSHNQHGVHRRCREARVCPSGLNATLLHPVGYVAGQGLAQRGRVGRVGEIPQPHGVIAAAGGQGVPVGAERHAEPMPAGQGLAQRGRVGRVGEIPQPHGRSYAAGGQGAARRG